MKINLVKTECNGSYKRKLNRNEQTKQPTHQREIDAIVRL